MPAISHSMSAASKNAAKRLGRGAKAKDTIWVEKERTKLLENLTPECKKGCVLAPAYVVYLHLLVLAPEQQTIGTEPLESLN